MSPFKKSRVTPPVLCNLILSAQKQITDKINSLQNDKFERIIMQMTQEATMTKLIMIKKIDSIMRKGENASQLFFYNNFLKGLILPRVH